MRNQVLNELYLGVFSRAEQRVLKAIFKAIADGGGQCVATLATLARDSGTSKRTVGNTVVQAVRLGIIEKQERRRYAAVSLPNILRTGIRTRRPLRRSGSGALPEDKARHGEHARNR